MGCFDRTCPCNVGDGSRSWAEIKAKEKQDKLDNIQTDLRRLEFYVQDDDGNYQAHWCGLNQEKYYCDDRCFNPKLCEAIRLIMEM